MKPPRVAAMLVEIFVAEPLRETLLGDLDERFQRDGSRTAYWKQAIAGVWHLSKRRRGEPLRRARMAHDQRLQ